MGQTQTIFLPPWVPETPIEKERAAEFRSAVLDISKNAANFVDPHTCHTHPDFAFDWVEHRPFAEAAYRSDPRLFKMLPRLVPKRVSEENYWRNYFSHVYAVKQCFLGGDAAGSTAQPAPDLSEEQNDGLTSAAAEGGGLTSAAASSLTESSAVDPTQLKPTQTIPYPEKFHLAVRYAREGPPLPNLSDADRILLEALFQQASIGQCNKPRPGMWDTAEEKAKYEAWKKLGNMSCAEAMHLYVQAIEVFNENWMEWDGFQIDEMQCSSQPNSSTPTKRNADNGSAGEATPALKAALKAMHELRSSLESLPPSQLALAREECDALSCSLDSLGVHSPS